MYKLTFKSVYIQGHKWDFPCSSAGEESSCHVEDLSSIPGSARSPGEGIGHPLQYCWASLVAQLVKNLPIMQETWVRSLGWEIPWRRERLPTPMFFPGEFHRLVHGVAKSQTRLSNFHLGFPHSSVGKESACNAEDPGSVPELGRSLEEGMATHSSILLA